MAQAADLPLPYPEVARIDEATLAEQSLAVAAALPARPLVLGGCCCAHVGAVEGVAARHGRVGVVWLDAHGDLNTPGTSPSGNEWGMPLRMLIDGGAVDAGDVVLLGARNLDPPEEEFIAASGLLRGSDGIGPALAGVRRPSTWLSTPTSSIRARASASSCPSRTACPGQPSRTFSARSRAGRRRSSARG